MKPKQLSIGIIGTGFGKMIGLNFKAIDPTINIYFYGRNPEKLALAVDEVKAEGTYDSWQELIADPKIDLVVIASPSNMHKEMFDFATKTEKKILIEKPAALKSSEVEEMVKTGSGNFVIVNHEGRFHPVITYIKNLIENGNLGDIMTVRVGAYLNWYSNTNYKESWNNYKEQGGGQIYALGSHQLDLANYLLDFPGLINGSVFDSIYMDERFVNKPTAESQFSAHFRTDKDTSIQLFQDCYCFGYKDFTIDVIGSKGIVLYSDQRGLSASFSNLEPLTPQKWIDYIPEVTLGNSILTKSMKYMCKAIIDLLKSDIKDERFCTLLEEKQNLESFEKFRI
jgi:predicted dehydrogenase